MCEQRTQILPENIVRRNIRRIENIADAPEDVAAVVKRHGADVVAQGNSRFEIDNDQTVAAERNSERIEKNRLLIAV